jgi:hypothetical protein
LHFAFRVIKTHLWKVKNALNAAKYSQFLVLTFSQESAKQVFLSEQGHGARNAQKLKLANLCENFVLRLMVWKETAWQRKDTGKRLVAGQRLVPDRELSLMASK